MWTNVEICKVKPGDACRKQSAVKEELLPWKFGIFYVFTESLKFLNTYDVP
jgi:hypothetical protein